MNEISKRIVCWQTNYPDGVLYNDIHAYIDFMTKQRFNNYYPTDGGTDFETRMLNWLDNLNDGHDQARLFRLIPELLFFGEEEFKSLYHTAYDEIITNWLIDLHPKTLNIYDPDIDTAIDRALGKTWFCSVTDSMKMADFCHINKVHGKSNRPNWRDFSYFADMEKVKAYIQNQGIEQIVLMEDFVGSGKQFLGTDTKRSTSILDCLKQLPESVKILILPLIICPEGVDNINTAIVALKNITLQPVLLLTENCFIRKDMSSNKCFDTLDSMKKSYFGEVHHLVETIGQSWKFACGSAFGYNDMGALAVLYSNCPDNTLAIIHDDAQIPWNSLFPRVNRMY